MNDIIIIREGLGIGYLGGIKYLNLVTEKTIPLKSYNGCLCFIINGKRLGYKTWVKNSIKVNRIIKNNCPF